MPRKIVRETRTVEYLDDDESESLAGIDEQDDEDEDGEEGDNEPAPRALGRGGRRR